jgi:hypothetical protein
VLAIGFETERDTGRRGGERLSADESETSRASEVAIASIMVYC